MSVSEQKVLVSVDTSRGNNLTIGKVYTMHRDGKHFIDDVGRVRIRANCTWADPEVVQETFGPLDSLTVPDLTVPTKTNDAGETNLDVTATLQQRGGRYGKFEDHAKISQELISTLKSHASEQGVQLDHVHLEALGMICHKLGRIVNGDPNYYDSWKDIAGYATLAEQWVSDGKTD